MKIPTKEQLEALRAKYPIGTRLVLDSMNDVQVPKSGTIGTVAGIDDLGDLLMKWDGGGSLKLIIAEDKFHVASDVEEAMGRF